MDPPARVWRDWVLVAVLVPAAVLEGTLRPDLPWRALSLAIGVGLVLTLLWRRTKPFLMVVIGFGTGIIASIVTPGDPPQLSTTVYLLLLPYALTRWGEGRAVPAGLAIVVTADVLAVFVDPVSVSDAAGGLVVLVATAAVGTAFRYRARARAREFERVKLVERERLARDLHDTVAHHVSAIAIRAQAGLATAATTPEAATEALRVIEAEAKRTLTEMRTMVRVLRRDKPTDRAPEARAPETRALEDRVVEDRTLEDRVPERVSRAASPPASRTRFGRRPAADAAGAPDQERALAAAAQDWPPLPQADDLAPNPGIVDIRRLAEENRAGPPITVRIAGDVDEIPPPSPPRSTASRRSQSPTPAGTRETPPVSKSRSRRTRTGCDCGYATTATPTAPIWARTPDTGCSGCGNASTCWGAPSRPVPTRAPRGAGR